MTPSPNGLAHVSSASTVTKACQEFVDVGVTPKPDIVLKVIVASVQLQLFTKLTCLRLLPFSLLFKLLSIVGEVSYALPI